MARVRGVEGIDVPHLRLEVVHDEPSILTRWRVNDEALPRHTLIGDDELLAGLEAAGVDAGIIRTPAKAIVTGLVASTFARPSQ